MYTHRALAPILALIPLTLVAQSGVHYPLQTGNAWVYRVTNRTVTVRIVEQQGQAVLQGLNGNTDLPLTSGESGEPLIAGTPWTSAIDPCSDSATVEQGAYRGPLGEFTNAIVVRYKGHCADGGLISETFLPYIGLVQRVEQTIAGPRSWDLVYAQIGGVTYVNVPHTSFGIAVQPAVNGAATVLLELHANQTLTLPTSQEYDFDVLNDAGDTVYHWSASRVFLQVIHQVEVNGDRTWSDVIPTTGLAKGRYTVRGYLTTEGVRRFMATTEFDL